MLFGAVLFRTSTMLSCCSESAGNLDAILPAQAYLNLLLPRRGAGVAEQGCLLSSYTPKGCRGFESPPLRHVNLNLPVLLEILESSEA